jgi:5-methylcytosine-specific restriction endonuclease McrA
MKTCRYCFTTDQSAFYPRGRLCRPCKIKSVAWWRIKKAGLSLHPPWNRMSASNRIRRQKEARRRYFEKNREIEYERSKQWAKSPAGKAAKALARKRFKTAHPEQWNKWIKDWHDANPEKTRQHIRNLSYRRRLQKGTQPFEKFTTLEIANRDGWKCHICRKQVTFTTKSIDHLIPLSKGGSHTRANVALAHLVCNRRRGGGYLPAQLLLIG